MADKDKAEDLASRLEHGYPKAAAALIRSQAQEIEKLTVQRDDARFFLRKLREQIQGDCV